MSQSFLDREGMLIVVVAIMMAALLAAGGYYLFNPVESTDTQIADHVSNSTPADSAGSVTPEPESLLDPSMTFDYAGQDGMTVLGLLKAEHSVTLDSELLLFGSIVIAIDSFESGPGYFWVYYKDSLRGDRSPDVCTTQSDERIRWHLQKRK